MVLLGDRRLDPSVLDHRDRVCTWGRYQQGVYQARLGPGSVPVEVTGHPRFDLYLQPMRDVLFGSLARAIRHRVGRFVLFNTNLSIANHGQGAAYVFTARRDDPDR
ncbi:MAG: hypothetical protein HC822_03500 [Oscillochloris sp.]|nr:hypothetical protein [Oscillochloris sp.]